MSAKQTRPDESATIPIRPTTGATTGKRPPMQKRRSGAASEGVEKRQRLISAFLAIRFFTDRSTGRAVAVLDGVATLVDSREFLGWASATYLRNYGTTVGVEVVREVALAMTGHGLVVEPAPLRFGGELSRMEMDLGKNLPRIRVTVDGVQVGIHPETAFRRPPGFESLPVPSVPTSDADAKAALDALREALGVRDAHNWACCVAWLLAAMRPGGPYPVLILRGEHGSGKSNLGAGLRSCIDPRTPPFGAMAKRDKLDDLLVRAEHGHVLGIDNVSRIDQDQSDLLCCIATGAGYETRALFTNRDLSVFSLSRPIFLTSITDAVTRPDLMDRALFVHLPALEKRMTEIEINVRLDVVRPRVLGALLWAYRRAVRDVGALDPPRQVRLRDAAAFAMAGAPALGVSAEEILRAFLHSVEVAHEVAADDPWVAELCEWHQVGAVWEGTAAELLEALDARRRDRREGTPKGWPVSARGVRAALDRYKHVLEAGGFVISGRKKGHTRERLLHLSRPRPGEESG